MRRSDQRRAAVFACYQRDVRSREPSEGELSEFSRQLIEGVEANRAQLDRLIADHSVDWELDRIAPLERAIMRVALFEVIHRADVPTEVAIDEAVETAKQYCGAEAPGFVNGILGSAIKEAGTR